MAAPTSAAAVANAFLDIADADAVKCPPVDQMKIQKLVFYSHAWWLAMKKEPLFDDDIEAWPWGPVVRDIYLQFKDCGRGAVDKRASVMTSAQEKPFILEWSLPTSPPQEVNDFLKEVWNSHKHMSGIQLSNATHAAGEPWTIVAEKYANLDDKPRIPNDLIQSVFKAKIPQ